MKKILPRLITLILLSVSLAATSSSQFKNDNRPYYNEWIYSEQIHQYNYLNEVIEDYHNNYIAVGETQPLNTLQRNGYLIKVNNQGQLIWHKNFEVKNGSHLKSIVLADDNSYILAGYINSSIATNSDLGVFDGWISKIDSDGNFIWDHQYNSESNDLLKSIIRTSDNHYVAVGNSDIYPWIIKIDSEGNLIWSSKNKAIPFLVLNNLVETSDGSIVAVGYEKVSIIPNDPANRYYHAGYILKIDSDGNIVFQKSIGNSAWNRFYSIDIFNNNHYVIVGSTSINGIDSPDINDARAPWVVEIDDKGELIKSTVITSVPNSHLHNIYCANSICHGITTIGQIVRLNQDQYIDIISNNYFPNAVYRNLIQTSNQSILTVGSRPNSNNSNAVFFEKIRPYNYLTFNANGGIGYMDTKLMKNNETIFLPNNMFTMQDNEFIGWALSEDDANQGIVHFNNNASFTLTDHDLILFAVWKTNYSSDEVDTQNDFPQTQLLPETSQYRYLSLYQFLIYIGVILLKLKKPK